MVATSGGKNRLSAPLGEVERGADVTITKRGVAVAKLVPVSPAFDREKARAAAGLRAASRGALLGGRPIRDLIEAGRR